MIKVHCFVSCVCEVIKKKQGVDHRPYYFGVWDADFDIQEGILTYHSNDIDHDFFQLWYELLYGIKLNKWYDENKSKQENIDIMLELIEKKSQNDHVMVMLDLSMLPERENKFNQKPFPHYVMIEKTANDDEWFMFDPDFRWEGRLPKEKILHAILDPSVKGGYMFNSESLIPPNSKTIEAYFNTCIKHTCNPIINAVSEIIKLYTAGEKRDHISELTLALKQLPVLAIRKYAYEHAFAYLFECLGENDKEFEYWCDEIERLVKGFTTIQYRAMKLAITKDLSLLQEIESKLAEQNILEFKIKKGLQHYFDKWVRNQYIKEEKVFI
ncbi:Petrobactin biosynthesis protein AsbE [Metabacillus litoralis]|uniref:Petrobactin biosynthesis protein AsbE n=1 Tax=Metabacillus litoralis TaxID=152268 RepID=A0A5C6W2M3_9BACI|nr:DUF6005 family protein [Metabacillus litoralis]TXC91622.1 Petrobactin biosynthesis protein AsbE [Metabacillus litoralis]